MSQYRDKVVCGFNKWEICLSEDDPEKVTIKFAYHPLYGEISLHDTSIKDYRALGEMFLAQARRLETLAATANKVK